MTKEIAKILGQQGLEIIKAILQNIGLDLFKNILIGFIIGIAAVLLLRRRAIPKREGGYKWLNRLYYLLILFICSSGYTAYHSLSKVEGLGQSYLAVMIDENRNEIDSVELVLKAGKTELMNKVAQTEAQLTQLAMIKNAVTLVKGKEAGAALGELISEHVNVIVLREGVEIIREWDSSGKPLRDVLKTWTLAKAHLLFKPYYNMIYLFIFVGLLLPAIEIVIWKMKKRKLEAERA